MRNILFMRVRGMTLCSIMCVIMMFSAIFLSADEHPYIFDWQTYIDTSVPGVTPVPHPVQNPDDWQSLFDTQDSNGGILAFMLRNPTAPVSGAYPNTHGQVLSYINTSGYVLNFVFADFESATQDVDSAAMVSQVRNHANPAINGAYIGNYGDCATTWDYREVWGNFDRTASHDFYINSGLNVSMPDTYPYSVYRNHNTRSDIFGANLSVSIPHALFWAPLERYSAAMRELPDGHIMIPWTGGFVYNSGYEAPVPSKTECRSLLQHIRLRGAAGYYTWSHGDNTNYTSRADYRDDMYANAWSPLDWFFKYTGSGTIFNLDTNKTGGIEWSGMRRGNHCLFIFSNYTANPVTVNLPANIENLPTTSPSIAAGEHQLTDYVIGPLAYWKMDENTGSIVYDKMSGGHNGTLSSGTWTSGKSGSCLSFSGSYGSLNIPDSASLDLANEITVETWLYPTAYTTGYASFPISKWARYNTATANFTMYFFGTTSGGNYKKICFVANAGGTWKTVSPTYSIDQLNTWYHIVWTYSSVNGGKLYINGVSQGDPVAVNGGALTVNNSNIVIGDEFQGKMDEVKIFSSMLTDQEVFDEYAAVLNLRLNERQGTVIADDSICAGNGTLSSGTWINGKSGSCLSFSGSYGSLSIPDSASLDLANEITVETWLYPTAYTTGYAVFPLSKWERWNTSTANYVMYFFGATAGSDYKKIRFYANAGGTWQAVSPAYSIEQLNTWYHIVWTYSGTGGGILYVNGVSQGNPAGSGTLAVNSSNVIISDVFQGKMDEIKIFKKALSSDEVTRQYKRY
ncbi:MAG: LamG domain-containing protein [Victivallaceae bacterium]